MSLVPTAEEFNESFEFLLHEQDCNRALLLVAEDRELLVGYALGYIHRAFYANGLIGWLEELYVLPEHRGQGTGKLLLSKFEEILLQNRAVLNALATRRANGFYLSCGYEESATYFRKILNSDSSFGASI